LVNRLGLLRIDYTDIEQDDLVVLRALSQLTPPAASAREIELHLVRLRNRGLGTKYIASRLRQLRDHGFAERTRLSTNRQEALWKLSLKGLEATANEQDRTEPEDPRHRARSVAP
jgi:hypothetical protein